MNSSFEFSSLEFKACLEIGYWKLEIKMNSGKLEETDYSPQKSMQTLTFLLEKRLHQHKLGEAATASQVLHLANQLLKKRFDLKEGEIKALKLHRSVLTIGVISSVWSQELWGCQEELLAQLQVKYGKKVVQKILIAGLTTND